MRLVAPVRRGTDWRHDAETAQERVCISLRVRVMTPDSSGVRNASITAGANSGARLRKVPSVRAGDRPGFAIRVPPPRCCRRRGMMRVGERRPPDLPSSSRKPASEWMAETQRPRSQCREEVRNPLRDRLANSGGLEQHVVPAGGGGLGCPLRLRWPTTSTDRGSASRAIGRFGGDLDRLDPGIARHGRTRPVGSAMPLRTHRCPRQAALLRPGAAAR